MEKVERRLMEPISDFGMEKTHQAFNRFFHKFSARLQLILLHKGLVYALIGFLLGRAIILSEVLPFALPFFGAVLLMKRDKALLAGLSLIAGGMSLSVEISLLITISIIAFILLNRLSSTFIKDQVKVLPFVIFTTVALTRIGYFYVINSSLTVYDYMMAGIESGLSFILTLIFLQSIPLISARKYKQSLKIEEIICIMILLASVMTGLVGVSFQSLQLEHIFSRYIVLLFAFIGGSSIGCTVGVVTGLILSLANVGNLYHMSLLAFSGLLGGLLREGQKLGTAIGLLVGSVLISLYGQGSSDLMTTLIESMVAIVLFLLTPKAVTGRLAKHIPGTNEHAQEQQQYVRKIRDVTAHRVDQFSQVFHALSESFATFYDKDETNDEQRETDLFLSSITESTCQHCFKKEKCWVENFDKTYDLMQNIMHENRQNTYQNNMKLKKEFDRHCSKSAKVEEAIEQEINYFQANQKLKKEVKESRRLVAEQLLGVSNVMEDLSREIKRERENHFVQEEQILDALQNFGIEIVNVEIYSLEQGSVDIEMSIPYCNGHGECEKIIAPMLSDILDESIIVKTEECANYPNGYCHVSFGSAKKYRIETGVAHAAKGGGLVSGDSYSMIELGLGKYAVAISDGMGNGVRAHFESNETIKLLQKILQSGIEEKVAIKTINSILSLRTTDEIFSTLDLAIVDLQDGNSKFLKIGSTPSFVKRGDKIIRIQASNLPMGIIDDFDVDVVGEKLKAGDLLIMMSDGIFEGPKHVENYDLWMKRKISEIKTEDPQEVADLIMEEVIRTRSGKIEDDMTVVVSAIEHNTPKWASIPVSPKKIS
ncbi:stage II sporulation protein E [Metabacillus crassostreae]|uniref:stage II sporulation protein E n=1 Tax=Metabacillus crassostreae TaxID=929098 RepID=UPI00195A30AA|nr:stage II sporulation protein E [Metabacillus crassostreae]MBM7606556.1 stage II sporulation protein E [Metabacillus crassostreae]